VNCLGLDLRFLSALAEQKQEKNTVVICIPFG
jgi:hypothetical protein